MLASKFPQSRFESQYGSGESLEATRQSWINSDIVKFDPVFIGAALELVHQEFSWPPHCSEFIKFLRGFNFEGIPDLETAYQMSCNRKDWDNVHDVVKCAAQKTGLFELRNHTREQTWNRFRDNYNKAVDKFLKGENIAVEKPNLLTHEEGEKITPQQGEQARKEFKNLKSKLGL